MGGGEGGWEPIRRRQSSPGCINRWSRVDGDEKGAETGRKQRSRKQGRRRGPGTGWLNACKSGRSGRMSRMPTLLPYPPCSLS